MCSSDLEPALEIETFVVVGIEQIVGDLETAEGVPDTARRIRELMRDHEGLLLACPEYNSSITPLLKNTIDWVSRPAEGAPSLVALKGKVATLMSASPGALGGLRGLVHGRSSATWG